jgi:EmrB/QacA subfamily drug resistance transporter
VNQPRATAASVGLRSDRGPVLASLMLATSLVALDSTIIATAVPSVVADLSGFDQFPWLFSAYLLAQAVTVPVYAKLADTFGRKPIMYVGIGLFTAGSVLCGFAWSMTALIIFRALQGLGAGAVQPMSMTIAGDIYTVAERAKAQGYLASVWGMSAVVGPLLGGLFSEYISWRWIFFVNIPLCVVAWWMLRRSFHETRQRRTHRIDMVGAALLTAALTVLILALLEGGQAWAWGSATSRTMFAVVAALLVVFVLVERRAAEPVLPLWVFRSRLITAAAVVSLLVGAIVMGVTSYGPTYLQDVLHHGPLAAGFALATMTIGWPIAASQSGRLYLRIGFRATAVIGAVIAGAGATLLALLSAHSSIWQVAAVCFVIGAGMGLVASPTLIFAQSSVGWSERGVVTGTNMFTRSMGSAVGVAVFGALANAIAAGAVTGGQPPDPATLYQATHRVFVAVAVLVGLMLIGTLALPAGRGEDAPADLERDADGNEGRAENIEPGASSDPRITSGDG